MLQTLFHKKNLITVGILFHCICTTLAQNSFFAVFNPTQISEKEDMALELRKLNATGISFPFSNCTFAKLAHIASFNSSMTLDSIIEISKKNKLISHIFPRINYSYFFTPNDSNYNSIVQWGLFKINAEDAWAITPGWDGIKIAIVDDAIDINHRELRNKIDINENEIPNNSVDDDGNGYTDDYYGFDVSLMNPSPIPPNSNYSHGTPLAGIAAASTNNFSGIASIGFMCEIIPVKASNTHLNLTHGPEGVAYAVERGAHIVNMSWGSVDEDFILKTIIDSARINKNVSFVAAAGNSGDTTKFYPAAWEGVISVAATNNNDTKLASSTYGSWVSIAAPGSNIYSTLPYNNYGINSGTSEASPLVAGLIGLMKSAKPWLKNDEIISCLKTSADPLPDNSIRYGAGRINAKNSLECILALGEKDLEKNEINIKILELTENRLLINSKTEKNKPPSIYSIDGKEYIAFTKIGNELYTADIQNLSSGFYIISNGNSKGIKFFHCK